MSSIAYVADENMLEYHRLCRNRTILFWRLSNKRKFTDFKKGDLLFFYSRPAYGRKKGLVGYAHYDSTKRLTLTQMWNRYGETTGYSDQKRLSDAIMRASKGEIPKQMSCLYLTDVVFFLTPVYAEEAGIELPVNLESYTYLDKDDPTITVRILECASKHGIDLWSADPDRKPDEIFYGDVLRHKLAMIYKKIGAVSGSEREKNALHKITAKLLLQNNTELIRGSVTDCVTVEKDYVKVYIPFTFQVNDRNERVRELYGRLIMYKWMAEEENIDRPLKLEVVSDKETEDMLELVKKFNE